MLSNMTPPQIQEDKSSIRFEPGTTADSYAVFLVFEQSYADLIQRLGITEPTSAADPDALARMWDARQSMYEHLATTADQFWLAKRGDGTVGFARSILRGRLRVLTEFFILPDEQSSGVGRELLLRVMPPDGTEQRWLLATTDVRAQALYLKNGLYPHFPIYYFWRQPRAVVPVTSDLAIRIATPSATTIQYLGDIDVQLLGHRRDVDHRWLMTDRQGYLYFRAGELVGYGYVGPASGPFALLDEADYPAVLAHAEDVSAHHNQHHFGLEVPMVNHQAVDYLLGNGFHISRFTTQFMSNGPIGRFSNYIVTSPPFVI